jgi:hypothetical protein
MSSIYNVPANAGGNGADYAPPPAGAHPAAVAALIDLGVQRHDYQGEARTSHDTFIVFELEAEGDDGMARYFVGQTYALSSHPKSKLAALANRLLGTPLGDRIRVRKLLGAGCLVSLEHRTSEGGNVYARVTDVTALPRRMSPVELTNETFAYEISSGDEAPSAPWIPFVYGKPVAKVIAQRVRDDDEE